MADSTIAVTAGSGTAIDTRTEASNGNHRQVIVIGDPSTNAGVAPVDVTSGLKVNLGADNDVTVTSGTVTANLGATDNAVLDSIDTATTAVQAAVEGTLTVGSHAVTNAGTFAVQSTLQTGSAAIGKLAANSGVDIGDVDVTSIVSGTGATNLGKAIDSAAGGTDTGVAALAIRDDALTTLTPIDGDYVPLRVSSTGALHVTGGGGGTEYSEDAATPATQTGTATMVERDDQLATVTPVEGDWIGLRGSSKGALWVTIPDASGDPITSFGGGTQYGTNTAYADTNTGTMALAVRDDATTTLTEADGDYTPLKTNARGALWVDLETKLDNANDSVLVYGNTVKDGSGTDYVPLLDADGHSQVDVLSSALPTGASTAANQSTIIGHVDGIEALLTTIDADTSTLAAAVSTEMQVDVVGALPAGTNEIGSLLPADTDVTAHTNYARKYYTSTTPTDGIIWSPAAGKRWHVVTMYINVSAASTVTLEDDKAGGDDPVWKGEIAANSGVVLSFTEQYPMASGEDAADLTITATAGTVYVTCVGYEI